MKRRSLALFLAVLMAFGSVLPVFAVEPEATEAVAEEKQETTLTYEDLYADGAVFVWDASDKTAGAIDFGEATEIVIAEKGDMQLILTKPNYGTAAYGDGYLEVNDKASAHSGATLKLTNVYTNVPAKEGEAYAYTTSATIALLAYQGYATPAGFKQYAYPFASSNGERMWYTYAMQENVSFISAEDTVKAIAWAQDYADAKADASKQATFRTPIREADYNALVAMAEYKDHVFVVNADDEDATNDPSTIYSITGYEADYTAYSYVLNSKGLNAGAYYSGVSYPVSKYPNLLRNGVGKTTFNTGTWVTDRDWQSSIPVWTAAGEGELMMQTRINTATKLTDKYQYDSAAYANLTEAFAATKTHATAPGGTNTGSGTSMIFAPGLDARFYGIRIYGRALTAAELQQNYFADLCKLTGVDLAKLEAIGEDGRAMVAAAYGEVSYAEADKAAIEELLDEIKIDMLYADMYVQDGLMYRWDAYGMEAFSGTQTLTMTDKDGRGISLDLGNVSYNSKYKVPETTNPYDFSKLITRTNGVYDEENLEFELVMTQTSFNDTHSTSNRPYLLFGPMASQGSGAVLAAYDADTTPKGFNVPTYGGYAAFYIGLTSTNLSNTNAVTKVTYYFDAEGKPVDAAVDGGSSVTVPYLNKTTATQVCTQDWASLNRYVGNYVGESYSIGGQIAFDLDETHNVGTMSLKLYRDGILNPKGTFSNIPYVPGYAATSAGTKIVPANYEEALAMSTRPVTLNSTGYNVDNGTFKVGGVMSTNMKLGYYAFRLYNRTLTDAERMQNHFADLCNYYEIDNIEAYAALSDEHKAAIFTQAQFNEATVPSKLEVSNTSFEDVTKAELEEAIDVYVAIEEKEKENAAYIAKFEKIADLYVDGATTFWSAFGAKQLDDGSTIGVITDGKALTVSGGTSAYADGYLRAYGGATLAVAGAYTAPANGQTLSYTTELVYAGYDSGVARTGENVTFETRDMPAFGTNASTTFTTAGLRENARFIDNESKAWYQAWTNAYAAASKDEALKAAFWTPVSAADYEALKSAGKNVRDVAGDGKEADPVGAYSQTGYETDWDGFAYVLSSSGLDKARYYPGYNNALKGYVGVANMNIMKNDWNGTVGGWLAQLDYNGSYGPDGGNWTRYDFGTVTTHAWVETLDANVTTAGKNTAQISVFSGDYAVKYSGKTTQTASGTGAFNTNFTIESFEADFYALRIYPFALTDAQRAQNHFVDLASYYGIDNVEAFDSLNDESKVALYDAFASVLVKDTSKAALENAITAAALNEYNVKAEDYISFQGYEIRLLDYAGLRSVYSVNKNVVKEGVTLKEVGAIMAIADGRTVEELTVAKNKAGAYVVTGKKMASTAIFADGAWDEDVTDGDGALYTKGDQTRFAYTCTFEGNMTDAGKLTTELLFRGYVVLEIDGQDYVLYTNMDAPSYEKISMYDVSKVFAENGYKDTQTVKDVLAACEK